MVNWGEKLGNFIFLERRLQDKSRNKKLLKMEKSMREIRRDNLIAKREKITKFHKIRLIYASKLKSNIIG